MSELPKGWVRVTISDLADVKGGKRLPSKHEFSEQETKYPYLRVTDLKKGSVEKNNLKYISKETRDKIKNYTISSDDLYITIAGTIGLVGQIPLELNGANLTENAAKICNFHFLEKKYLMYFLQSKTAIDQFSEKITSSGQPKLALFRINDCTLGLAPQAEQTRIVEKLDEVLAQVDAIKTRLDSIPAILKRFRQSVLAAAVSGRLTEEWRGIESYTVQCGFLGDLAKFIDYRGKTPLKTESGIPLITAKNIRQGYISREPREYIGDDDYEHWMTRGIPNIGDVLITTEAPMGYVANIDITEKFALAQRAICLQFDEKIDSYFASIYMRASPFQQELELKATGSTVKGIKASLLKKIEIEYPSIDEQKEIVRLVDQYFAFADTIEAQVKKAQTRVDNLTQSILAKAFRGELVPQNPSDEPAEKLLERIAQARKEAEALAKAAKKVAKTK